MVSFFLCRLIALKRKCKISTLHVLKALSERFIDRCELQYGRYGRLICCAINLISIDLPVENIKHLDRYADKILRTRHHNVAKLEWMRHQCRLLFRRLTYRFFQRFSENCTNMHLRRDICTSESIASIWDCMQNSSKILSFRKYKYFLKF